LEMIGGGLGGQVGGLLPDQLEPAISSWHRGTAHSYTLIVLLLDRRAQLLDWVEWCREQGRSCERRLACEPGSALILQLWIAFWSLAAGFVTGLLAGYVSHLALDALTPHGLPLF
jgi:membrane-bound metal-dependent hydrolase YbcI (DUF457 family)